MLDVACGSGRHLHAAASAGFHVTGVDRELSRISRVGAQIELIEADLETDNRWPLSGRRFDGVIVTNYLHRPLLPEIITSVASDGILIYETFAVGQQAFGRPRRPEFLLQPGELLEAVQGTLMPMAYEHLRFPGSQGHPDRLVQRIAAVGRSHRWLLDPPSQPVLSA